MKFEAFKSGVFRQQYQYKSFLPAKINDEWSWEDTRINVLLEKATRALGELNAFTLIVPNVDLFIRLHIVKEANTSSRIEGTKTEIDEVIMEEQEIRPERRDDWHEVQNYIKAMNMAIEKLNTLPLSLRLLRQTHAILMEGVRGKRKMPGEFRRSQNWIGGASLADAAYIPPHHEDIPELLTDLEAFWHNEKIQVPYLVRCALSHYQFETIHPFLDGNGRIGRLLIDLFIHWKELLDKPLIYTSLFFKQNRQEYFDRLMMVRKSRNFEQWIEFFLKGMHWSAKHAIDKIKQILLLQENLRQQIIKEKKHPYVAFSC